MQFDTCNGKQQFKKAPQQYRLAMAMAHNRLAIERIGEKENVGA
jgi:hypothetical protein